ncbi:MAG: hypothetical protein JRN15_16240, partial [Nitrososphaerota archaeon]|nr:hypothetical protein [Nitrososphaerota archaeon]
SNVAYMYLNGSYIGSAAMNYPIHPFSSFLGVGLGPTDFGIPFVYIFNSTLNSREIAYLYTIVGN